MHRAVPRRDACAARTVHPDGVDLVAIGHGVVALGEIADAPDRGDITVHRIKAFENDQLHAIATRLDQQLLEMRDIILPPDFLFAT